MCIEGRHAVGAETASLECAVVAVERALGLRDLLGERGAALGQADAVVVVLRRGVFDRVVECAVQGWLTAMIQDLVELKARGEDLERARGT